MGDIKSGGVALNRKGVGSTNQRNLMAARRQRFQEDASHIYPLGTSGEVRP
eukprot:CAMPEP_0196738766 /NCGR_PEP_ID=MMETSP1091-20130531/16747_1 /TAXON_ID=302021 /ORGANISM="Rhodomonas sp., Strain CCMP768" /LENGTH=50 /DNA_ID=CAMNT_0042082773 /DNA_START=121 /DNA_END=270 /DNA_ORIENTATION=+